MDVITTHVNADFDCLGAMVAARKLYPHALMVFSGSQEKSMRDFFLKSTGYALDFTRLRDVDLDRVTRLILVDCQHVARIGRFAEIINRPGLVIHIFDHHPHNDGCINPAGGVIRECGSTTTIITRILMEQGAEVTPVEATLMMLGIYEDTGSLTFPSTTADDYHAAAWLLERGAQLKTVADFITQELTPEQISLLNDLLKSLKTTTINGIDVSIASTEVEYYIGDIAVLAHMMRDMENLDCLFLVVGMAKRVYIVARSRLPEVDAGEVLRQFGGGGHASAASATVKDLTLLQVLEQLGNLLRTVVTGRKTAADLMSTPVRTVTSGVSIAEARELLTRYNLNALPVLRGDEVVGIISRRIVEKALYHNLGSLPVMEYMHTEFMSARPDTPITELQDYIVGRDRRLVPVMEEGKLVGVVTRTDLLRYMYAGAPGKQEELHDLGGADLRERRREVEGLLASRLPAHLGRVLRDLGAVGDELALPVYAVGGFVRDLLLNIENSDIDVTIEGDGILFAEIFAGRHACRVKSHEKFGTAVIVFPDGYKIDVASTRLEYYESPGALPTVERSTLKQDLYRRDFTINTLAIRLNRTDFGIMVDYFGAQRDLKEKVIRVLHNLSFVEDSTRVFRAIRFEQRLDFHIAAHTENLIRNAVKMNFLAKLGGKRVLNELVQIFREKDPIKAVKRLASLGLLPYIHEQIHLDRETEHILLEAQSIMSWFDLLYLEQRAERWVVYFLALTHGLADDQFWSTCLRLAVTEHYRQRLCEMRRRGEAALRELLDRLATRQEVPRSAIFALLKDLSLEVLLYLMAKTNHEGARKAISLFFTTLHKERCLLSGNDLRKMGVSPGPRYRELFDMLLDARLNGVVQSREDEVRFVELHLQNL